MNGRLRRWRHRLAAAWRLDPGARWCAGEAVVALAIARILVLSFPLHTVAKWLSGGGGRSSGTDTARRIARLLLPVARVVPFRAKCLEQALALTMMLRRRRIISTLHLGTTRGTVANAVFEAHAWLSVEGEVIVGGPIDRYVELTRF